MPDARARAEGLGEKMGARRAVLSRLAGGPAVVWNGGSGGGVTQNWLSEITRMTVCRPRRLDISRTIVYLNRLVSTVLYYKLHYL